jgi:hypothetical protein
MSKNEDALRVMEQTADYVATATGIRQQFIDAGWTQRGAEDMTRDTAAHRTLGLS